MNSKRNLKYPYLLNKRVRCKCGYKMQALALNKGKNLYYRCPGTYPTSATRKCDKVIFRADQVDAAVWNWVKEFLSSDETLEKGFAEYKVRQAEKNEPLLEQLQSVNRLLAKNQEKLNRLLDLYLEGDFEKEVLTERKSGLEKKVGELETEKAGIAAQLDVGLTEEKMKTLKEFRAKVTKGFDPATASFTTRKRIVEILDAQTTLIVEDGQKVVYATCHFGNEHLPIVPITGSCYNCQNPKNLSAQR
ncbi:recombinase zinc beta ribbon domain-containing protein [Chloroflexota bacterium]